MNRRTVSTSSRRTSGSVSVVVMAAMLRANLARRRGRYPRPPMMDHRTIMGFQRDEAIRQRKVDRAVMRRVLRYIRPYLRPLIAFVVSVILGSVATAVTPLLLKELLDKAIPPAHH